ALDPRPVPRTLATDAFPGAGRVLDRQRRHDAPQSRPAGRGDGEGQRSPAETANGWRARFGARPDHPMLGAAARRQLDRLPRTRRRRGRAGPRSPAVHDATTEAGTAVSEHAGYTVDGPIWDPQVTANIHAAGA